MQDENCGVDERRPTIQMVDGEACTSGRRTECGFGHGSTERGDAGSYEEGHTQREPRRRTMCKGIGEKAEQSHDGSIHRQYPSCRNLQSTKGSGYGQEHWVDGRLELRSHHPTRDEDGRCWDFNDKEMRNRAVRNVIEDQPFFLSGSPMCTAFSIMHRINYARMASDEVEGRLAYGRAHLEFCAKCYATQWKVGRYFLHGHPAEASSWQEDCIKTVLEKQGVLRVVGDPCQYGLTTRDGDRLGLARKRTGFMTNSICLAKRLERRCPNKPIEEIHKHIVLEGGRTRAAQVHPPELCKEICRGIQEQIEVDRRGEFLIGIMDKHQRADGTQLLQAQKELQRHYKTFEEDDEVMLEAFDDVSGATLDPRKVQQARREEVEYVRQMGLYTKVPIIECRRGKGKNPITVRWIDVNKGDASNPNYRSRFVAREINTYKREDLFAAIPPLEAFKVIISFTATANNGETVMVNDIRRAFFHAKAEREVYVQSAPEDTFPGEEGMCRRLRCSMYGTRDAALTWYKEYSGKLVEMGFTQRKASPCMFYHEQKNIRAYAHGGDYVITGLPQHLHGCKRNWRRNTK